MENERLAEIMQEIAHVLGPPERVGLHRIVETYQRILAAAQEVN